MSWPTIALLATAVLAAVAAVAAVVAVRAVRRLRDLNAPTPASLALDHREASALEPVDGRVDREAVVLRPVELEPRVVEGRVIVPPTQAQVVRTALGRPGVRLNVLVFGLRHALRPENRDRIVALMRREYRHRRYERMRAARQAVRSARPSAAPTTDRLHAQLAEPRQPSLADRMML